MTTPISLFVWLGIGSGGVPYSLRLFLVIRHGGPGRASLCSWRYSPIHYRDVGVSRSDLKKSARSGSPHVAAALSVSGHCRLCRPGGLRLGNPRSLREKGRHHAVCAYAARPAGLPLARCTNKESFAKTPHPPTRKGAIGFAEKGWGKHGENSVAHAPLASPAPTSQPHPAHPAHRHPAPCAARRAALPRAIARSLVAVVPRSKNEKNKRFFAAKEFRTKSNNNKNTNLHFLTFIKALRRHHQGVIPPQLERACKLY